MFSEYEIAKEVRWCVTVIHHAALRSKRKYRRWENESSLILNQVSEEDGMELIEKLKCPRSEQLFFAKEFESLLNELPEQQHQILYDLYIRDWTQQQTAGHLGITQQQVSRLHARAILSLSMVVNAQ